MKEIDELRKKILNFNEQYEKGTPIVDDYVYDFYKKQLKILEKNEEIQVSNEVGFLKNEKIENQHIKKVLSLDHDFGKNSIEKFVNKIEKKVSGFPFIAEVKIDGVSIIAKYQNGFLKQLKTRGDGTFGEDFTHLKNHINIPDEIYIKEEIEIRFEAYIDKNIIKNARNVVAGMLMKKKPSENLKYMKLAPHNLYSENFKYETYEELTQIFEKLHLKPIKELAICNNLEEMQHYFEKIEKIKDDLDYEIDGVVFKINDIKKQEILGNTAMAPKHSFAIKFENPFGITIIQDIVFQVTRSGRVTPVAILEETDIKGRKINKATLNNFEDLKKNGYGIGDIVKLEMAGEVIPMIKEIIEKKATCIELPENCPCCDTKLNEDVCENEECFDQIVEKLYYFASKPCLNIENLGRKQIEFFVEEKILKYPYDFFELKTNVKKIKKTPSWLAQKSLNNLTEAIEKAKYCNMEQFYTSLGMPNLGKNKTKMLTEIFNTFDDFLNAAEENFIKLGPKIAKNVYEFKEKEKNWIKKTYDYMKINEKYEKKAELTNEMLF